MVLATKYKKATNGLALPSTSSNVKVCQDQAPLFSDPDLKRYFKD
jgi:hypothetical protein